MATPKQIAHQNLGIREGNKIILSCDGGGMRGILTIQLLKKLESIAGSPCYQWCDMVAGTSTGGIIAGLILKKKNAKEIEDLYVKLVSRVFTRRNILANRYYNPPAYDKENYRNLLKDLIGNSTLEEVCTDTGLDCIITSKDLAAGEETFFTCVNNTEGYVGTYKSVLLRGVMEATMSAPTYFSPFERFIDGGTTTYNNPVMAAVLEALEYTGRDKYKDDELTVFSLGTGTSLKFLAANKTQNPKGIDALFWLNYVMSETGKDASEMQIDTLRSGLIKDLDLRRYQISFDKETMMKLPKESIAHIPSLRADWLSELDDEVLANIDMDDVTMFPLMISIGNAMVNFICPPNEAKLPIKQQKGNWFRSDFINEKKRGILVSAKGDPQTIKNNLSNISWIDKQPTA
ncbi:patatin-like phospholipase family protein [Flavobacterium sp.]|uniref:patatin-like phospholipase family protein n=1 Tax=Flavobacterium sp. TaxID=239 RepID=UPI002C7D9AD1|nr:patatin-like phospholipase family protein [Flavobacterium sp.]HSD05794.1 patatin-like phospholipase family protein [Flavobacterium sp.]